MIIDKSFLDLIRMRNTLDKENLKKDYRDLVSQSSDFGSCKRDSLLGRITQDEFFANESLLSLKEVIFIEQKFSTSKPVSDIKYYHTGF